MNATNELLQKWLDKFGDAWDAGPPREGWQSDELLALIEQTRTALVEGNGLHGVSRDMLEAALSASPSPAGERLLTCQCAGSETDPCIICGKGKTLVTAEWVQKMAAREGDLDATTGPASPSPVDSRDGLEVSTGVLNDMLLARAPDCRWTIASILKERGLNYRQRLDYMRAALSAAFAAKEQQP